MEETTVPEPEQATDEAEAAPEPEPKPPQKMISFARGVPAPECLPVEELADCAEAVLKDDGKTILSYGSAAGYMPLREHIGQWFGVDPARVVITNGALQGFVLLARRLARGQRVLIEEPTYDRAIKILQESGASLATVQLDDEGITPESLEDAMRISETAAFLYTIPTFQNPSGRTMSAERRRRIVELASFYNLQIVEDDPYGLVRYEGEPQPSLFELSGKTLHLQLVVLEDDLAGPARRLVHPPRGAGGRAHRGRRLDLHHARAAEPGDRARVHPARQLRAEPRARQRPAQGAPRRDAGRARHAPLGLHLDAPAGRLLHLARVPARARSRRPCSSRRRASRSSPASTAAASRTPRGSRSASSPPRRSSWASSESPPLSSAYAIAGTAPPAVTFSGTGRATSGGCGGGWSVLPAARKVGHGRSRTERAEAVAAEVAVLAGGGLVAHPGLGFLGSRGLAKADPRDPAAPVNDLSGEKTRSFRPFRGPVGNEPRNLGLPQCRQCPQRLLKTLHRDDPQAVRVLAGFARVVHRHEESIHTRLPRADRLLLDPADRADLAVEEDLAGRGDLEAAVDVASELLHHVEREREPGGGAADAVRVDRDRARQLDVGRLVEEHADDRTPRAGAGRRPS